MLLNSVRLFNFGLYSGHHSFDLRPRVDDQSNRNIVLVGGVNGAGKTTLLDAVQLALYGPRAECSKRNGKSYEKFLRESIHHGADLAVGAAVEVSFEYALEGENHTYVISRSWKEERRTHFRERVMVKRDGGVDRWMSENWHLLVEEILPSGIARLCFFDAEKIRFLADDETSAQALASAIKSLLGLDLVEHLLLDIKVLAGRIAKRTYGSPQLNELDRLEEELRSNESKLARIVQDRAALENVRLKAEKRVQDAEMQFAQSGGEHWAKREESFLRLGVVEESLREVEAQLVHLSGCELPIGLTEKMLSSVIEQASHEKKAKSARGISKILKERDEQILDFLSKDLHLIDDSLSALAEFLRADRGNRSETRETEEWLSLSEKALDTAVHLLEKGIPEKRDLANQLLHRHVTQKRELERLRRDTAAIPKDDAIRDVASELKSASLEFSHISHRINRLEREEAEVRNSRFTIEKNLEGLRGKVIDEQLRSEEDKRLTAILKQTKNTMRNFLSLATTRKIDRLSRHITECFRFLLRKQTVVDRVDIDPTTFTVSLINDKGQEVLKERLSEGEKQIFAISVLWGLLQASSRRLPVIVDTPMARLDSQHRDQLVSRYFPNASHQVVVLSTDTEVEREYFESLKPYIAHAYHLVYSEAEQETHVTGGYFWREELNVASEGQSTGGRD